ncbi:hypothetical protein NUACC21_38050 [Scytonema sp. NUACC21]
MSCKIGSSYTIEIGDTLFNIAQQQLNNGDRWREILKSDGTSFTEEDVRNLQVGQEVCIPLSGNGSTGGSTSDGFASIVSRQTYESIFPERDNFYTYESLMTAVQKYSLFCNEGSKTHLQSLQE